MGEIMSIGMAMVITGFCVVLLKWVWIGLEWVWVRPKKLEKCLRKQGFSGNSYRILVGDLMDSSKMDREVHSKPLKIDADICPRVLPFIHHTVQTYGKNCFTWLGPYLNMVVMDPEMLREILTKHEGWPKPIDMLSQSKDLAVGLVRLEGEEWSKQRKFLNPGFHMESLKNMLPGIQLSCKEMINEWEAMASPTGSAELDSWPYCCRLSNETLARTVFGNDDYKDGLEIFQLQKEHINLGMEALRSVSCMIPGFKYLPTKFNRRLKGTKRMVQRMLKDRIEKKQKHIAEGGDETNNSKDLISFMLISNSKLIEEKGVQSGLTLEEIIEQCEQLYGAGETALSVLFVWTLVMLSQHQDWQDKAREEILQVFGDNEPDIDGLSGLKIVTMFLNEVMRLYPPTYFTVRSTKREMKLDKLTLPAGVIITVPLLLIHHDPDLWGNDVKEFKPERFADGVAAATNGRLSFLPFLTGPRTCIGQRLAMIQVKLLVAMLLQRFSLHLSPAYTHAPFPVMTLLPQHGARITIRTL